MNRKQIIRIIIIFQIIFGCNTINPIENRLSTQEKMEKISICLSTKKPISTKSNNLSEEIENVIILIYNQFGQLAYSNSYNDIDNIVALAPVGMCTIAAVANYPLSNPLFYDSLEKLRSIKIEAGSSGEGNNIFSRIIEVENCRDLDIIELELNKIVAMFTFVFDKSDLNPDISLNITNIELKNVPASVSLFESNVPASSDIIPRGPYISNNTDPLGHEEASPLYIFENLQGISGATSNPSLKAPMANQDCCSYAEISAQYSSTSKSGTVKYRIYLGENNTTNFNIHRDTHYKESIKFTGTGISEQSWRVDLCDLSDMEYQIDAIAIPPEGGTVSNCGRYKYGTIPNLEAIPSSNYIFTGWLPQIVPVTSNMTYVANFSFSPSSVAVTGISIIPPSLELDEGETYIAGAVICPSNATNKGVIWSSSNESIATINCNTGQITARSKGTTTITATSVDGGHTSEMILKVFQPVEIVVNINELFEYDNFTDKKISAVITIYARVKTDVPSNMTIVRALAQFISINLHYSYIDKGQSISGNTVLTLNEINNNDTPWNYIIGGSDIIIFTQPSTEEEIEEAINSLTLTITHCSIYTGLYHAKW